MARRRLRTREAVIDGRTVVVVEPHDFELLDGSRRQVGALQARQSRVNRELVAARAELASQSAAMSAVAQQVNSHSKGE
jgi:hypothetical protein